MSTLEDALRDLVAAAHYPDSDAFAIALEQARDHLDQLDRRRSMRRSVRPEAIVGGVELTFDDASDTADAR